MRLSRIISRSKPSKVMRGKFIPSNRGRVSAAGLPSLVASKAAADTNNPQINGTYTNTPVISFGTTTFTGITTAYPSSFSIALHMAAYQYEGGLPYTIGGKVFLYGQSVSGSSGSWTSYTATISDGAGAAGTFMDVSLINWGQVKVGQTVVGATGGTTVTGQVSGVTGGIGRYTVSTSQLLASSPLTSQQTGLGGSGTERRSITHTGSDLSFSFVDNTTPYYFRLLVSDDTNGNKPQYTDRIIGYATPGDGLSRVCKIDFNGVSKTRTITLEAAGGLGFLAWQRRSTDTMTKPADTPNPRIHFLCDSIGGALNNPTSGLIVSSYTASCTTGTMTVTAVGTGPITVGQPVVTAGTNLAAGVTVASQSSGVPNGLGVYVLSSAITFGSQKVFDGQPVFPGDAIVRRMADLCGAKATIDTIGGTGWDAPTHNGLTTVINRVINSGEYLGMVASHDIFTIDMGVNDVNAINGGAQTFAANTAVMISSVASICAFAAANPTKIFIITGAWYAAGAVGAGNPPTGINATYEAAIQQAVIDGKLANPGGRVAYFKVQDIFWDRVDLINADLIHPNYAGTSYAATIMRDRFMASVASV